MEPDTVISPLSLHDSSLPPLHISSLSPLAGIESQLRWLLPPKLYVDAWNDTTPETLTDVFHHLRTLRHALTDYLPQHISDTLPQPGVVHYTWNTGALMFTDLAGFTPMLEANAAYGAEGAESLLVVLNDYFTEMITIVSKAGGTLLEFTGDALLVQFTSQHTHQAVARATRAGLRMQRAMQRFAVIRTRNENLSLGMRIGIHCGTFLTADIGTPRRMEQVLLGKTVLQTKVAEGMGEVGMVNLTHDAYELIREQFQCVPGKDGHWMVEDNPTYDKLGDYEITTPKRRMTSGTLLLERSIDGLLQEITTAVTQVQALASYLPLPIVQLLVEATTQQRIAPEFPMLSVLFVNIIGLPESLEYAKPDEEAIIVRAISRLFAHINAAVEARGGVLKNVTYHHTGLDMLIYFGVPVLHLDDALRAARTAIAIRQTIKEMPRITIGDTNVNIFCQIGMSRGGAFAAEVGELRGRREFNVLGDTVNVAARLMSRAGKNQILITEAVQQAVALKHHYKPLGLFSLKGKSYAMPVFALEE